MKRCQVDGFFYELDYEDEMRDKDKRIYIHERIQKQIVLCFLNLIRCKEYIFGFSL